MISQRDTLKAFTDAAADAVARAIAAVQRDAQKERELRDAEHRARLAELDGRVLSVIDLERKLTERLATLKDGEPGPAGKNGRDGFSLRDFDTELLTDGKTVRFKFLQNGTDDSYEYEEHHDLKFAVRDGVDGKDGTDGIPGVDGKDGSPGRNGADGLPGQNGRDGVDGKDGERGPEGSPGKLPTVKAWEDRVFYEGDVVAIDGRSFQALRDTGREPPHVDWICIAERGADGADGKDGTDGQDGRSFRVRGTWLEIVDDYRSLDVVALNGASFIAKRDNPGACPGEGWQMIAGQGKRGQPGQKGDRGERGEAGLPVVAAQIDGEGILTLTNGDGSQVTCDLYPLLSKLAH